MPGIAYPLFNQLWTQSLSNIGKPPEMTQDRYNDLKTALYEHIQKKQSYFGSIQAPVVWRSISVGLRQ